MFIIIILLLLIIGLLLRINSKLPKRDMVAEALERYRLQQLEAEKKQSSSDL